MQQNYNQIMSWLAVYEGGFVNHRLDPGGATNRGVTQRVYDAYRARMGRPSRSVRHITDGEHDAIYAKQYWQPIRGADLPGGIDASVFDMAVHSGPSRAAQELQKVLGVKVDGQIGEVTLAACREAVANGKAEQIIIAYNKRRMSFLKSLDHWPTFATGWTRRVIGEELGLQSRDIGVLDRSVMLARKVAGIPAPRREVPGKAEGHDAGPPSALEAVIGAITALFSGRSKTRAKR